MWIRTILTCVIVLTSILSGCRTPSADTDSDVKGGPTPGPQPQPQPQPQPPPEAESVGGLRYQEYEVLFTNPVCKDYPYGADQNVVSNSGQRLTQKPKNVFCTRFDSAASASRPEAPQYKLLSWIADPQTTEIFFAYLSFSNRTVQDAVCRAVRERNVKVTFVIDQTSDTTQADALAACMPGNGDPAFKPKMLIRGHAGGIGYAHNKIFLVNPNSGTMRIAVSSGNMSSGVVLHHENWHFITPERDTYFAQAHLCLMKGVLDYANSKDQYAGFIKTCRSQIQYPEETDIKTFFIPGEGTQATNYITNAIRRAGEIRLAAHRFGYSRLINALKYELDTSNPAKLSMIFDDDTYWAGKGQSTGDNEVWEYNNAMALVKKGAEARWMETNHAGHLLHHNKFLIFNMPAGSQAKSAVFGGAGNLTGTGFTTNFENFYYIEIPKVVDAFNKQYDMMWNQLATTTNNMPKQNVLPPGAE